MESNNRSNNRRDADTDFSVSVNKKLRTSARTGQACDRCKIRKIRCDSTAGGCSPCAAAQFLCKTTDRNTGRATIRGHTERLENEIKYYKTKLQASDQVLKRHGIPIPDSPFAAPSPTAQSFSNDQSVSPQARHGWQPSSTSNSDPVSPVVSSVSSIVPILSNPPALSNHAGLKMLMGTKISLFGTEIDGTEFDDDSGDTASSKTYQGILTMTMMYHRGQNEFGALLPTNKAEAMHLFTLFFSAINVYAPVLDKRNMAGLIGRIYDDQTNDTFGSYTMPEKIMVHMTFASIKHQLGVRTQNQKLIDDGVEHFKYCMVHFGSLLQGRTLPHVQAICCLAVFSRNYQRPEAAWFILHPGLWVAIELELHRSVKTFDEGERAKFTDHDIELRKRCFWCIYGLSVTIGGRLGKPMPLRLHDIDIEFPEEQLDFLPHESDLSDFHKCSFRVAVYGAKMISLLAQLYSSLYSLRRTPANYEADLAQLEEELKLWKSSTSPELRNTTSDDNQIRVHALFIKFWELEFVFLLRHPVIRQINLTDYDATNLKECLEICGRVLQTASALSAMCCLDVQWITMAFLIAVVFTTLFVWDLRKSEMTEADLQKLKADMEKWDQIFGATGKLLGGSPKIQAAIRRIVNKAVDAHEQRLAAKQAAAVSTEALTPHAIQRTTSTGDIRFPAMSLHQMSDSADVKPVLHKLQQPSHYMRKDSSVTLDQTPHTPTFVTPQQYPYVDAASASGVSYHPPYAAYATAHPASNLPPTAYNASPSYYGIPPTPGEIAQAPMMNEWMRWTQSVNMFNSPSTANQSMQIPPDFLTSATSLVALSEGPPVQGVSQAENQTRLWPMNFLPGSSGPG